MRIIIALLIFGLIVLIHELGHFLLAKKSGILVQEFSIGMGPKLVSFTKNDTKYCIKLLPLGGSCMMLGEDDASDDSRAFGNKSVWARMSVIVAGPVFNFILAFFLAIFLISFVGCTPPTLASVEDGSAAMTAGLQEGDKIQKLDNSRTDNYKEVSWYMQMHQDGEPIAVKYKRGDETNVTMVTPMKNEHGAYALGVGFDTVKGSPIQVIKYSAIEVKYWIKITVQSIGKMVTGQVKADQMSGPVGIVNIIGDTYTEAKSSGFLIVMLNLANISILLSANLGVMNLLPIPALDGGRLIFLIIEAIRGKKLPAEKEGFVHFIGFCALMGLMVLVMFNDIKNLLF